MKKVRFGIVGVGGMGQGHAEALEKIEEADLRAVCDIDRQTAVEVAKKHGVEYFLDHKELIKSGLVDAVIVATPHYDHPPIGIAALKKGLHLLSEKPLAVTVGEADKTIKAAAKSGLKFAVMFQMRAEAHYRAAKQLIEDGRLGELYRTLLFSGWFRNQSYYDSGDWRATWCGEGGGILINQSPHTLDMFTWLGGMPTAVQGMVKTRKHNIEVEDEAAALLAYANGAHGYLYASTFESPSGDRMEFCGDKGKLVIEGSKVRFWSIAGSVQRSIDEGTGMWDSPEYQEESVELKMAPAGHPAILRNFARSILRGEKLMTPGEEAIHSLELANAVLLSGMTDKRVMLPLKRKEVEDLLEKLRRGSQKKTNVRAQRVTDPHHK